MDGEKGRHGKKELVQVIVRECTFKVPYDAIQEWPQTTLAIDSQKAKTESEAEDVSLDYNRNPAIFRSIVELYFTGQLHVPRQTCWQAFRDELVFWKIKQDWISPCCHAYCEEEQEMDRTKMVIRTYWDDDDTNDNEKNSCLGRIWTFFEKPDSSRPAQIWSYVSTLLVFSSLVILGMETLPRYREEHRNYTIATQVTSYFKHTAPVQSLVYLDLAVCLVIFAEFVVRFISCPRKRQFLKSVETNLSFISIVPSVLAGVLYSFQSTPDSPLSSPAFVKFLSYFFPLRILRVVCLLRFGQYFPALRVIILTLRASVRPIILIVSMMLAMGLFFGGCLFHAEMDENTVDSIPTGMWWAIVTSTTVGYGDYYPATMGGYVIAWLCASSGLLITSIPIAVISLNFSRYEAAMSSLLKEKARRQRTMEKPTETVITAL